MYLKTPAQLKKLGVKLLPRTLEEALDAFEADPLSRRVFGDKMFSAWLGYKRDEWLSYTHHVSDWEKNRYLKFF
jgi:glutamine synthetase